MIALLTANLSPEKRLQKMLQQIGESLNLDQVAIFQEQDQTSRLYQQWSLNDPIDPLDEDSQESSPSSWEFRASLAVHQQNFGSFRVSTRPPRPLTPEDIHTLELTTRYIVLALNQAQTAQYLATLQAQNQALATEKQEIQDASQNKNRFLSQMSHELRTPLTGILGFSQMLLDEFYGSINQKQQQYLQAIYESGKHLLDLINDLLDISKIEANREELLLETIPVEEVCLAFHRHCRRNRSTQRFGLEFRYRSPGQILLC